MRTSLPLPRHSIWMSFTLLLFAQISFGQKEQFSFSLSDRHLDAMKMLYINDQANDVTLPLYMPNGKLETFSIKRNGVLSQQMRRDYPGIMTFDGTSADADRLSLTIIDDHIQVQILNSRSKAVLIQYDKSSRRYESKYTEMEGLFNCHADQSEFKRFRPNGLRTSSNGSTLRNYSIAIVITDEFEAANGGGGSAIGIAAAVVNDMSALYKSELAVTFTASIVPEDATYNIMPTGSPDANAAALIISKYFTDINSYDVGQVFHTTALGSGWSGVAGLGVVCNNTDISVATGIQPNKARGWSQGQSNNDYSFKSTVYHEVAHQFNATHTFNSTLGFCSGNTNIPTSYEPGSGSTLMSYPGVCMELDGSNMPTLGHNLTDEAGNIYYSTSPYFHVSSLEQMVAYMNGTGNACATTSPTNNTPPVATGNSCNASAPITIPANTPFQLKASYTDANNDAVTFNWEQFDAGPPNGAPNASCGSATGPIFRSYSPTSSPVRYFPSLQYILKNGNVPPQPSVGECLPTASRLLNFKVTVRDNNTNGGGIDVSSIQLTVDNSVGPLAVSAPNTATTWAAGTTQMVTWTGSNTSSICANVNILLSIDGGYTFPITLANNVQNDGNEAVTLPANIPVTTMARIKVESSCLTCVKFFDISNADFTITGTCEVKQSNICPASPLTATYTSSALNLGLSNAYGSPFTSKSLTTSGSAVNVPFNTNPMAPGATVTCSSGGLGLNMSVLRFKITQSGTYTFSMTGSLPAAVFSGIYNSGSPCTNILGSTAFLSGGLIKAGNSLTLSLNSSCGEYSFVLYGNNQSATLTITGPAGAIVYDHNSPAAGFSYTFAAVNSASNLIDAVSSVSDFTSLTGGTYCIYGINYYSGSSNPPGNVDPNAFIGKSLDQLWNEGKCILASSNCKPVTVTCPNTVVTNSGNSGAGTLRDVYACVQAGGTITFQSGVSSNLSSPLLINKNVIIQGNPGTVIDLNFAGSYGIKVNPPNNLTLKDVRVNLSGTATPVIQNEGNLILNNVEIIGNVNPVVNNIGNVNVAGTLPSTVKKM